MGRLNRKLLQTIVDERLQDEMLRGRYGLEKENVRVDGNGKLALTPHPRAFGNKMENPYIKTDFSESQLEMITPAFGTMEEAYHFLESLHDIVTLELGNGNELLWPSSNPPVLPAEEDIPIARMNDPEEDRYRMQLADKYGRKRQLISGIHFNFSFEDTFLSRFHTALHCAPFDRKAKDGLYMKVARLLLKHRWLLVYLTGASPVFNKTYLDRCVQLSDRFDDDSYYVPHMNSFRNSVCGYRNMKQLPVSYESVEAYVRDLQAWVQAGELLGLREYYSPVRMKPAQGKDQAQALLKDGIAYLELRMLDLNPLYKTGVSLDALTFLHLFLVFMLLAEDEPFGEKEQHEAVLNQDSVLMNGIRGRWYGGEDNGTTLEVKALELLSEMDRMLELLTPAHSAYRQILQGAKEMILNPEQCYASIVKSEIRKTSFLTYHLEQAKAYAVESEARGYQFSGYTDLELSTQLLLKAAVKRGIAFELLDREENFVLLQHGDRREYVKQATKTSLDSYSTVLLMENKVVTKEILKRSGIRVPEGKVYRNVEEAVAEWETYRSQPIVIKPKSTNFGLGITIFTTGCTQEEARNAFELAFSYDRTVLLEEFIPGKEYRFLVMGGEVVGVLHRVPANVVGDGVRTIEQLIHEKNKDPLRGKGYTTPLERLQLGEAEELVLRGQSRTRNDVPHDGEIVYLRENSNISTGGDSMDFTDVVPESYKRIAVESARAAGAVFCGVDMMIPELTQEATDTNYCIIELNFNPAIHIHCYPYRGQNRKAGEKIVDLLFGPLV